MSQGEEHPLTPMLAATEIQLQSVLDEVCEEIVIEETATDELIRIEETLAVASETAKAAISLRRRINADGDAAPPLA